MRIEDMWGMDGCASPQCVIASHGCNPANQLVSESEDKHSIIDIVEAVDFSGRGLHARGLLST